MTCLVAFLVATVGGIANRQVPALPTLILSMVAAQCLVWLSRAWVAITCLRVERQQVHGENVPDSLVRARLIDAYQASTSAGLSRGALECSRYMLLFGMCLLGIAIHQRQWLAGGGVISMIAGAFLLFNYEHNACDALAEVHKLVWIWREQTACGRQIEAVPLNGAIGTRASDPAKPGNKAGREA